MRIISRYIAVEFIKFLGWLLSSFIVIYLVIDLSRVEGFLRNQAQVSDIVSYYLYKLPLIIFQSYPGHLRTPQ
jgi:lipopolysaccharide export LptBFGC system permease protein LptF